MGSLGTGNGTMNSGVLAAYADLLAARRVRRLDEQEEQRLSLLYDRVYEIGPNLLPPSGSVVVDLSDEGLASGLTALLASHGIAAVRGKVGEMRGAISVVDAQTARSLKSEGFNVALILVNVSGPDALVGALQRLKPAAFVSRPASAEGVFEALLRLLIGQ